MLMLDWLALIINWYSKSAQTESRYGNTFTPYFFSFGVYLSCLISLIKKLNTDLTINLSFRNCFSIEMKSLSFVIMRAMILLESSYSGSRNFASSKNSFLNSSQAVFSCAKEEAKENL